MSHTIEFIYFDLGNVLLYFSRQRQFQQMADVLGVSAEEIDQIVKEHDLMHRCETGKLSPEQTHAVFCDAAQTKCDFGALCHAGSNIFELNSSILPLITQLSRTGHRLGILSNTSESHWEYCLERYSLLRNCFEECILSYEVGTMKPEPAIYQAAVEAAGVPAENIFYTDDLSANIKGAIACGMDAVLYTDTASLADALRNRNAQIVI